jgi:hypothetical protein
MKHKVLTFSLLFCGLVFFWHCTEEDQTKPCCGVIDSLHTIKYSSAVASYKSDFNKKDTILYSSIDEFFVHYEFNYDILKSEPLAAKKRSVSPTNLFATPATRIEFKAIHHIENIEVKSLTVLNDSIQSGDTLNQSIKMQHPKIHQIDNLFALNQLLTDSIHLFREPAKEHTLYFIFYLDKSIIPRNKNLQLSATFTFDDSTVISSKSKRLFIKD